jgi:hypothetical protein
MFDSFTDSTNFKELSKISCERLSFTIKPAADGMGLDSGVPSTGDASKFAIVKPVSITD